MSDKLKPCPHCGREAMMIKTQKCGRYVMCMWCEARTRECETDYLESAYDKSANAWNRRAEIKPIEIEVDKSIGRHLNKKNAEAFLVPKEF